MWAVWTVACAMGKDCTSSGQVYSCNAATPGEMGRDVDISACNSASAPQEQPSPSNGSAATEDYLSAAGEHGEKRWFFGSWSTSSSMRRKIMGPEGDAMVAAMEAFATLPGRNVGVSFEGMEDFSGGSPMIAHLSGWWSLQPREQGSGSRLQNQQQRQSRSQRATSEFQAHRGDGSVASSSGESVIPFRFSWPDEGEPPVAADDAEPETHASFYDSYHFRSLTPNASGAWDDLLWLLSLQERGQGSPQDARTCFCAYANEFAVLKPFLMFVGCSASAMACSSWVYASSPARHFTEHCFKVTVERSALCASPHLSRKKKKV
jgi:hypothetical protein